MLFLEDGSRRKLICFSLNGMHIGACHPDRTKLSILLEIFIQVINLVKQANEYKDLYMKSNRSTIAFVLRFEYLLIEHYDIDACMNQFYESLNRTKIVDKSVFVAADIGKYRTASWEQYLSEFSSDKDSQYKVMETFHNVVSLLIGDQWTFEDWENSFTTVTAGIEANGYIAALQKTIAGQADCIYFLVPGGNFQSLIVEEYVKHHPHQTEPCIHYICHRNVTSQSSRVLFAL